ncbi:MAG: hypothetical protein L0Y70_21355 [Gemmataceae bacterium]|nr:hypothetical protein [Gemmataceae bacterium]
MIRRAVSLSLVLVFGGLILSDGESRAQGKPQPQQQPTSPSTGIGFKNDFKVAIIVQGWSVVNGQQRRGQPLLINPGKVAWDNNVPSPGKRYYSVYDANQPSKVYLRDFAVPVALVDQFFAVQPVAGNAGRAALQKQPVPKQ